MVFVFRDVGSDELDSLRVVISGKFLPGRGVKVAEDDEGALFGEEVNCCCPDAVGAA